MNGINKEDRTEFSFLFVFVREIVRDRSTNFPNWGKVGIDVWDTQSGYTQFAGAIWVHLVRESDPGVGTPRLGPLDQARVWGFATHWVAGLTGGWPLSYPSIPAYCHI